MNPHRPHFKRERLTKPSILLVSVLALVLAFSGCSGSADDPPSSGGDGTFTRVSSYDAITDWDPAVANSNEGTAFNNIYETLTHYNLDTQEVEPALATTWKSSANGRKWTFTLREDVTFHTGNPATASVAAAAIQRTIDLGKGSAYIWSPVKAITAPDDTTLVFDLKYAADIPLIASAQLGAYIYDTSAAGSEKGLAAFFADGKEAGTGPYKLADYSPGQQTELTLDRFDAYWGGWDGAHYSRVVYETVSDVNTAWQLLSTGEVDWVQTLTPQLFEQAESASNLETTETRSVANLLAFFNTQSGPLADERIRKALQVAIDYEGIIDTRKGAASEASGLVPPGLNGASDDLGLEQDLDEATDLLEQAGYGPNGKKLSLTMTYAAGDDAEQTVATIVTSTLKSLNVDLRAQAMDFGAQADMARGNPDKRQDIFVMYWYPSYADPQTWFSDLFLHVDPPAFNFSYLDDPEVNEGIQAVQSQAATDPEEANDAYVALQERILESDAAAAPIFVQTYQRAYRAGIEGYVDNPVYTHATYVYDLTPPS
jgi:peptide/nickel transport system substrate-binding protein